MKYKGWTIETVYVGGGDWIARAHKGDRLKAINGDSYTDVVDKIKEVIDQ